MSKRKVKKLYVFGNFVVLLYCALISVSSGSAEAASAYDAQDRRDPFVPLISSDGRLLGVNKDTQQELEVNGIIYDKNGVSYAIVNSTVVRAGESIGDYKVLKVEQDKVVFEKNGQPLEIGIYKEDME